MDKRIQQHFKEVCEVDELSSLTAALSEYEEMILHSSKDLMDMLDVTKQEKRAEELEIEDIIRLSFENAHRVIDRVSFPRRLQLLADLDKHLIHLYDKSSEYNDQGFGRSMPPKIFQQIMGRIKHLEIIQNWLYGIE